MADTRTVFNKFQDNLYINDGTNYLYYDGTTVGNVSDIAYIPTTTIGRKPSRRRRAFRRCKRTSI